MAALLPAACSSKVTIVRPESQPVQNIGSRSLAWEIPPAIRPAGNWFIADCRLLSMSSRGFLDDLDIVWQEAPVSENAPAARFAQVSAPQLMQFKRLGKGEFSYLPTADPLGLLLLPANGSQPLNEPDWHVPTMGNNLLSVKLSAVPQKQGRRLNIGIVASEGNPRDGTPEQWKGTAQVPAVDGCILVDIPTAAEEPGGTRHRVMLMIVLQPFRWQDTQLIARLPWNRGRIITINDREIRASWMPPEDLGQRVPQM